MSEPVPDDRDRSAVGPTRRCAPIRTGRRGAGAAPGDDSAFEEIVDGRFGSIRVRGRLTPQGADMLRGTVTALRRSGHRHVLLDLRDLLEADAEAMANLRTFEEAITADGGRLTILDAAHG